MLQIISYNWVTIKQDESIFQASNLTSLVMLPGFKSKKDKEILLNASLDKMSCYAPMLSAGNKI